ncbi:4'-phosphopantetheinyl transferase [Fagus crenata]
MIIYIKKIGIDVEEKQRKLKNNILAFAQRQFNVGCSTEGSPLKKGAYVKALGRGFSATTFKTFTIRFRTATKGHLSERRDSEVFDAVVDSFDDPKNLTSNWQSALLELVGSHYAAICIEGDRTTGGKGTLPMKLTGWRTIPLVER